LDLRFYLAAFVGFLLGLLFCLDEEPTSSSETSGSLRTTGRQNEEHRALNIHRQVTSRSVETRCQEFEIYLRMYQADKSVVAEHSIEAGHRIKLQEAEVPDNTSGCMDRLVK
jgi:hypothetical protein